MPLFDYEDEIVEAPANRKFRNEKRGGGIRKRRRWPWLLAILAVIAASLFVLGDM